MSSTWKDVRRGFEGIVSDYHLGTGYGDVKNKRNVASTEV